MAANENIAESGRRVVLGRITGLHGVRGWVKLHSYTEPREAILDYSECLLQDGSTWRTTRILDGRKHGKGVVASIAGIESRDDARERIGAEIAVLRERMPEPEDGHYYWADLEGLTVIDVDGRVLGTVDHLLATGSNDVLVVRGDKEILVPFIVGTVITDVNLDAGQICVDWEWE